MKSIHVCIVSGKGGVGKTTVAINLASAISTYFKENPLLIDANLFNSHLALYLGMYYFPYTLASLLRQNLNINDIIYKHPTGLRIIPNGIEVRKSINFSKLERIFSNILKKEKIVIIDSPPGFSREIFQILKPFKNFLIVSNPDWISLNDAKKIAEILRNRKKKIVGIVLNRVSNKSFEVSKEEFEKEVKAKVIGEIPESDIIKKSVHLRNPLVNLDPYNNISLTFGEIASFILNKNFEVEKWKKSFIEKIFERISRYFYFPK
ncbi:MAG: hypothetical protein B6U78_02565 [Candidatus Aenigmarchaeota archaeon ex4484_224]|nr:MAG: hypothetical protein B6U78_02565 [Candidatus Aenigmarchaeota archaeon ex4484_224]